MDVFDGPHYRLNKFLLTCLGQWPYQKSHHKLLIRIMLLIFGVTIIVPETVYMMAVWGDLDEMLENGSLLGIELVNVGKFLNYMINADKIKILMNRIQEDWKADIFTGSQLTVLRKYADQSQKLTEIYAGAELYMYVLLVVYTLFPLIPKLFSFVMGYNATWPDIPYPLKYGNVDPQRYYLPILLHSDCTGLLMITFIIAMDTTYVMCIQHACGIFAAVGDRLKHLMNPQNQRRLDDPDAEIHEDVIYQEIVSCIKIHLKAIEFANAIESAHVVVYFFVVLLTIMSISIAGYQMLINFDKPSKAMRLATVPIGEIAHIFFLSWPGQRLIDHSERVHEWVYGVPWYKVSIRCKRLLMLMMFRSIKPCTVTAGKYFTMSLINFSMVVRASASYFTMLNSFR